MKEQNFSNHAKYYVPHHFIFLPAVIASMIISATYIFKFPERWLEWGAITLLFFFLLYLATMLRQHYALGNQNRIVRLEMRLRYFELTQQRFQSIESKLSFGQLAALRFAPDDELLPLLQRTLGENLSPSDIKKSIVNWLPDHMRV